MSHKCLGACSQNIWKLPWQSSGYDLVLSLPGAWVQFLVRELKSHKLLCAVKKKKKKDFGDQVQERELRLSDPWCLSHHLNILPWPGGFFPMRIAEHLRHGPSPHSFGFSVIPKEQYDCSFQPSILVPPPPIHRHRHLQVLKSWSNAVCP